MSPVSTDLTQIVLSQSHNIPAFLDTFAQTLRHHSDFFANPQWQQQLLTAFQNAAASARSDPSRMSLNSTTSSIPPSPAAPVAPQLPNKSAQLNRRRLPADIRDLLNISQSKEPKNDAPIAAKTPEPEELDEEPVAFGGRPSCSFDIPETQAFPLAIGAGAGNNDTIPETQMMPVEISAGGGEEAEAEAEPQPEISGKRSGDDQFFAVNAIDYDCNFGDTQSQMLLDDDGFDAELSAVQYDEDEARLADPRLASVTPDLDFGQPEAGEKPKEAARDSVTPDLEFPVVATSAEANQSSPAPRRADVFDVSTQAFPEFDADATQLFEFKAPAPRNRADIFNCSTQAFVVDHDPDATQAFPGAAHAVADKAEEEEEEEDEDIFQCATQAAQPRKTEAVDIFDCATQAQLPEKSRKRSSAKLEPDDIFACATQALKPAKISADSHLFAVPKLPDREAAEKPARRAKKLTLASKSATSKIASAPEEANDSTPPLQLSTALSQEVCTPDFQFIKIADPRKIRLAEQQFDAVAHMQLPRKRWMFADSSDEEEEEEAKVAAEAEKEAQRTRLAKFKPVFVAKKEPVPEADEKPLKSTRNSGGKVPKTVKRKSSEEKHKSAALDSFKIPKKPTRTSVEPLLSVRNAPADRSHSASVQNMSSASETDGNLSADRSLNRSAGKQRAVAEDLPLQPSRKTSRRLAEKKKPAETAEEYVEVPKIRGKTRVAHIAKAPPVLQAAKKATRQSSAQLDTKENNASLGQPVNIRRQHQSRRNADSSQPTASSKADSSRSRSHINQSPQPPPRILFTVVQPHKYADFIQQLGGLIVQHPNECSVLVTNKVYRTYKFLSAVARGAHIVSEHWLEECRRAQRFLPIGAEFALHDEAAEERFKFVLAQSLRAARERPILAGFSIFVTPSTKPTPSELENIINCAGGRCLLQPDLPTRRGDRILAVSAAEDRHMWPQLRNVYADIEIVNTEALMSTIMQQRLTLKPYRLK